MNLQTIQTMSSREIADLTGKQHAHVMEAIRNMEPAWEKVTGRNFPLSEYTDSGNVIAENGKTDSQVHKREYGLTIDMSHFTKL